MDEFWWPEEEREELIAGADRAGAAGRQRGAPGRAVCSLSARFTEEVAALIAFIFSDSLMGFFPP